MSSVDRPIGAVTRRSIILLWDAGFDSYEIAKRCGLTEPRVLPIIRLHVTTKFYSKTAF